MNTLIIINGPPKSGKDSLCNYAEEYLGWSHYRPVDMIIDHLGLSKLNIIPMLFKHRYKNREYRESYRTPIGKTMREVFISYSEDFLKPMFGRDIIGKLIATEMAQELNENTRTFAIVQAMGDVDEIRPIVELNWQKIILVHTHREGCSFEGDSRRYFTNTEATSVLYADWVVDLHNGCSTEHGWQLKFYNEVVKRYCEVKSE